MNKLKEYWQQYKPLLIKIGLTLLLIPLLIFGGGVLFSIIGFLFSIILGFIILVLVIAVLLAVWGYTDVKLGKFAEFKMERTPKKKPYKNDDTITVKAKDITNTSEEAIDITLKDNPKD